MFSRRRIVEGVVPFVFSLVLPSSRHLGGSFFVASGKADVFTSAIGGFGVG